MSYNYVQSSVKQAFSKSLQMWNFPGGGQVYNLNLRHWPLPSSLTRAPPAPTSRQQRWALWENWLNPQATLGCRSHQVHPGHISRTEWKPPCSSALKHLPSSVTCFWAPSHTLYPNSAAPFLFSSTCSEASPSTLLWSDSGCVSWSDFLKKLCHIDNR